MDDILLSNSNVDSLERVFEKIKKVLPSWGLKIAPKKGDSINYLGYKICLQKYRTQKVQIKKEQLQNLNDVQRLLADISNLQLTSVITIK